MESEGHGAVGCLFQKYFQATIEGFSRDWGLMGAGNREIYIKELLCRELNKLSKDKGALREEKLS